MSAALDAPRRFAPARVMVALAAVAAASFVVAVMVGAMHVPAASIASLVLDPWGGGASPAERAVVGSIRLPRATLALLVGAVLGGAGAISQGLFRNPLADPGLVGVSAGGALGAALAIVLGGPLWDAAPPALRALGVPLGAFAGALVVTSFVLRLGANEGRPRVATMLLAGIAVTSLVGAAVGALSHVASDDELRDLTFWTLGGLGGTTWRTVLGALLPTGIAIVAFLRLARALDPLALGEGEARALGVDVARLERRAVIALALGVGGSVAAAGPIGFVGLVVPHLGRRLVGPRHTALVPVSMLLGAVLVVVGDAIARTVVAPAELPIGVLTALLGAPFFLWLLRRGVA